METLTFWILTDIQLQLWQKLKPVPDSWLDKDKVCLQGTRTTVIEEISQWIESHGLHESQTFILCGEAGTGKSTISHTIGRNFEHILGAFFSFNRQFLAQSTPASALRTIAYQLGIKFPEFGTSLIEVIKQKPFILEGTATVEDLWDTLVVTPAMETDNLTFPILIMFDALDECDGKEGPRGRLLSILINTLPQNFCIFITSRPENSIMEDLNVKQASSSIQNLKIRYMEDIEGTRDDVLKYVCSRMMKTQGPSLKEYQCRILADKAAGFFQWAAIVCTSLLNQGKGGVSVSQRFEKFISLSVEMNIHTLTTLDKLYEHILNDVFDTYDPEAMAAYRIVMSQVLAAFEPLTQNILHCFQTSGNMDIIDSVLSHLGSLLTGVSKTGHIKPVHASVLEFLIDKKRSKQFWIDLDQGHQMLAEGAFHIMFKGLHFNMANLETSYILNSEVLDLEEKIACKIAPELLYACCFWDAHLKNISPNPLWQSKLDKFFDFYLLYWLEVLGLNKKIYIASRAANIASDFINRLKNPNSKLVNIIREIPQFIQAFGKMITEAIPHLYLSGLPFIPKGSGLYSVYRHCCDLEKQALCSRQITSWPNQQVLLKGHLSTVNSVAFSPDGTRIVSGSHDETLRLWNSETGEAIGSSWQGHSDLVTSVAFSPNGETIISGSEDMSIRIWNAKNGDCIGILNSQEQVKSIAFSADGKKIVSGSSDSTIRFLNADTIEAISDPLSGHSDSVTSVAFSPNGKKFVSGSKDRHIKVWNAATRDIISIFIHGDNNFALVFSVAFSPDSQRIVSGSINSTIRIWDIKNNKAIHDGPWKERSFGVYSVAFSPDGQKIVAGHGNGSIILWNAIYTKTGLREPFDEFSLGHIDKVKSVAFSPDGNIFVSGSNDKTIIIWDAKTGEAISYPLQGHFTKITAIAFSPNGSNFVSGSLDGAVIFWNVQT
ncbi:WD40-repeat-containing domain protein, partial [Lentinula raphanica]